MISNKNNFILHTLNIFAWVSFIRTLFIFVNTMRLLAERVETLTRKFGVKGD